VTTHQVVIIGGGCAGLSAANTLRKQGVVFTLFEAGSLAGGRCRTELEDGYMVIPPTGEYLFLIACTESAIATGKKAAKMAAILAAEDLLQERF
jgi:protoporphyrinogen oxidase